MHFSTVCPDVRLNKLESNYQLTSLDLTHSPQLRALCCTAADSYAYEHLGSRSLNHTHRHRGIKIKCKIVKLFQMNDVMARTHIHGSLNVEIYNSTLSHTRSLAHHNQQLHALSAFAYISPLYLEQHKCVRRSAPLVLIVCDLAFYSSPNFQWHHPSGSRVLFVICIYEIITLSLNQSIFIAMWAEGDVLMACTLIQINSSCCGQANKQARNWAHSSLLIWG